MEYILKNVRIPVSEEQNIFLYVDRKLQFQKHLINNWAIFKRALDTRKKKHPYYVYTIKIESEHNLITNNDLQLFVSTQSPITHTLKLNSLNPYIVGMGPAGLFSAIAMVENGLKPIIIDRGRCLEDRIRDVNQFWKFGELSQDSNVQYGEGGAGAFSDGKLTCRTINEFVNIVFKYLVRFGAPESILIDAHPHLGTDIIRKIVHNIKNYLTSKGCIFYYDSILENIDIHNGKIHKITVSGLDLNPELVILAIGNSSRDTFKMLFNKGVMQESKAFSIGFRISHHQEWIDNTIYGDTKYTQLLGAASYRLSDNKAGHGTYTFCMCPGGYVIAASNNQYQTVTNGMSYSKRDGLFGNSAIVTNVNQSIYGTRLFDGISYQEHIEYKAFNNYAAPYQNAEDYLVGKLSKIKSVDCLFPTTIPTDVNTVFDNIINSALHKALVHFNCIYPGFIKEGLVIAPETRTSSPIRILRNKYNLNCIGINNLYAVGEGAGYSGGIISSAADGYRIGSLFYY